MENNLVLEPADEQGLPRLSLIPLSHSSPAVLLLSWLTQREGRVQAARQLQETERERCKIYQQEPCGSVLQGVNVCVGVLMCVSEC